MATEIKLRRGTTSQHASFNGAEGEVTFDTDLHTLIVHNNEGNGTGRQIALLSDVQAEDTLAEMNDVNLTSPADGSVLKYDNASSKWIDSAKLTETASGIDVTGEVKGDTLDIDGNASIAGAVTDVTNLTASGTIAAQTLNVNTVNAVGVLSTGIVSGGSLDINGNADISGNLVLGGDLNVTGTTTTVNQTNLDVSDNIIGLNRGASTNSNDSGFIIERGSTGDNAIFAWDESADKFTLGTTTATPSSTGDLTITTGTLVANVEGNLTGTIQTAAQTNITSVGDLTALNVDGTVTADGATFDVGENKVLISGTGQGTGLRMTSSESASQACPDLILERSANGTSSGENIGAIHFDGKNAGASIETFAQIFGRASDYTAGDEDGIILFRPSVDGTLTNILEVDKNGIDVTGTVTADGLNVDTSNNFATINVGTAYLNVIGTDATSGLKLSNTNNTTAGQSDILFQRTENPVVNGTNTGIGQMLFEADNSGGSPFLFAGITAYADQFTAGSEEAFFAFTVEDGTGSRNEKLRINKDGIDVTGTVTADSFILEDGSGNKTTLAENASGDITLTLPSATGTVALTSDITVTASSTTTLTNKSISGEQINSGTIPSAQIPTLNQDTTGNAATATVAKGAAVTYDASNDGAIGHATVAGFVGKTVVYTNTGDGNDLTLGLPDVGADISIGEQIHLVNASSGSGSSALIILDLSESGTGQTVNICTGATVLSNTGSADPHIVAGGVATLVATADNTYVLFGSGVVDN